MQGESVKGRPAAKRSSEKVSRRAIVGGAVSALCFQGNARAEASAAIHVRVTGTGARTWLLIHPFGASGRFWQARAAALADAHGLTVLAPDLPSHGASAMVDVFDYRGAAGALASAISSWPQPELIVGASSGGIVGLMMGVLCPAPVAAIGVGDSFSSANIAAMLQQSNALDEGTTAFVSAFLEQGDPQRRAIMRHYGDLAARGVAPFLDEADARALADRTFIINGAIDSFFHAESGQRLAARIPGSMLMFQDGAGHLDPLGQRFRARTWNLIEAFRRSIG